MVTATVNGKKVSSNKKCDAETISGQPSFTCYRILHITANIEFHIAEGFVCQLRHFERSLVKSLTGTIEKRLITLHFLYRFSIAAFGRMRLHSRSNFITRSVGILMDDIEQRLLERVHCRFVLPFLFLRVCFRFVCTWTFVNPLTWRTSRKLNSRRIFTTKTTTLPFDSSRQESQLPTDSSPELSE